MLVIANREQPLNQKSGEDYSLQPLFDFEN